MTADPPIDPALLARLPLPLAQLYRRAHHAQTPTDKHQAAFYSFEVTIKLLAATAVVEYADRHEPDADIARQLEALARPSLGQWWGFAKRLIPVLSGTDPAFARVGAFLFGRPRDDCPALAGLAAVLAEPDGTKGVRGTVDVERLFDDLVTYRNVVIGHGAVGMGDAERYRRVARAMIRGLTELFTHTQFHPLAGRTLVYVGPVTERHGVGAAPRWRLVGPLADQLEDQLTRRGDAAPEGDRVYLACPGDQLRRLHPLAEFVCEADAFYLFNSVKGRKDGEFLCYSTGLTRRVDARDRRALLARVMQRAVADTQVRRWEGEADAADESPPPAAPGGARRRQLGDFELVSEIGRGGMGVVYTAWQPSLQRAVAVKLVDRFGDPQAAARFSREIRAHGQVDHPHVVKVYASGADPDGRQFFAMELLEGVSLAHVFAAMQRDESVHELTPGSWERLVGTACSHPQSSQRPVPLVDGSSSPDIPAAPAPTPPPPAPRVRRRVRRGYLARVAELIRQTAEAAEALHRAGIIHRDIKPGNIQVSPDGKRATLIDLGVAHLAGDDGRLTVTQQFVGTARYASPQQLLSAGRADPRNDVYSLGATLWELLTLQPLYSTADVANVAALLERMTRTDPADPRTVQPEVPAELAVICLKCLEHDPEKRYQSAQEVADEIERWQQNRPILARPSTGLERGWKWVRRNRGLTAAVTAVSLALIVGTVVSTWQWLRAEGEAKQAKDNEKRANAEAERADREAATARRQAAVATDGKNAVLLDNAYQVCVRNDLPTAERLLTRLKPEERDNPEGRYVEALIRRKADPTFGVEPGLEPVHIQTSTDGRVLASEYQSIDSPNFSGFGKLTVFRTADRKPLFSLPRGGEHSQYLVSKDGKRVVSMRNDDTVCLWDADTGRKVGEWAVQAEGATEAGSRVVLTPDGRWFVTCTADGVLERRDLRTGERTHRAVTGKRFDRRWGERVRFLRQPRMDDTLTLECATADGTRVRVNSPAAELAFDLTTGELLDSPNHPAAGRLSPVFATPDGSSEAGIHDTAETATLSELHTRGGFGRRWFPLVSGSGGQLKTDAGSFRSTPDGRFLSVLGWPGECGTWDLRTGQPVSRVAIPRGALAGLQDRGLSVLCTHPDDPRAAVVERIDVRTGHRLRKDVLHLRADLPADRLATAPARCFWHPGGRYAVFWYDDERRPGFEIWDLDARRCTRPFTEGVDAWKVHFSPESDRLLVEGAFDRHLYSAADGKQVAILPRQDRILDWSLSPDGSRLITCHADGGSHLWDVTAGTRLTTFDPPDNPRWERNPPRFCMNGERFVAFREGKPAGVNLDVWTTRGEPRLVMWDARTGESVAELPVPDPVPRAAVVAGTAGMPYSDGFATPRGEFDRTWTGLDTASVPNKVPSFRVTPDGRRLVLLTHQHVEVLDAKTLRRLLTLRRDRTFDIVNVATGGETVFGHPPDDPTAPVQVYDTGDIERVEILEATATRGSIRAVSADPTGGGVWAVANGFRLEIVGPSRLGKRVRGTTFTDLPAKVIDLRFRDERVVVRSEIGVSSWDPWAGDTSITVTKLVPRPGDNSDSTAQTTDGEWVVEASPSRAAVVVNRFFKDAKPHELPVRSTALGWVGDGRLVVGHAGGLTVWHLDALNESFADRREASDDSGHTVFGGAWTGGRAVAGRLGWTVDGYDVAADGRVQRAQTVNGKLLKDDKVRGHIGEVFGVAASPDGTRFATSSFDGSVQVWEAATTTPLFQVSDAQDLRGTYRYAVAFHPSGRWLLASRNPNPSDGTEDVDTLRPQKVVVYDAATGKRVRTIRGHDDVIWQIAFDATGERMITCGQDQLIRVWDFASGEELFHLSGHKDWVLTAKFTPDGTKIVSGGRDNVMKVWDVETRQAVGECEHPSSVTKVCLTADGSRAITACGDGQVRFWNLHTAVNKLTINAGRQPVWALDLSRDETRLLSGGEDGTFRVWVLDHPKHHGRAPQPAALQR